MGTSITRSLVPLVARIEKLLVSHIPMPSRLARCSSATLISPSTVSYTHLTLPTICSV